MASVDWCEMFTWEEMRARSALTPWRNSWACCTRPCSQLTSSHPTTGSSHPIHIQYTYRSFLTSNSWCFAPLFKEFMEPINTCNRIKWNCTWQARGLSPCLFLFCKFSCSLIPPAIVIRANALNWGRILNLKLR